MINIGWRQNMNIEFINMTQEYSKEVMDIFNYYAENSYGFDLIVKIKKHFISFYFYFLFNLY